jgi:hypothetical protein
LQRRETPYHFFLEQKIFKEHISITKIITSYSRSDPSFLDERLRIDYYVPSEWLTAITVLVPELAVMLIKKDMEMCSERA